MAIIRLEDKYKSKYKIQLTPERHYISSSSGITGSVHVFPNRSRTQKDNIDERLNLAPMAEEGSEFSGKPIRPYDSNSLEQRRIEIFRGEFNKLIGGPFSDAIQYIYQFNGGNWPGLSPTTAGTITQTGEVANNLSYSTNDTVTRINDKSIFEYDSNGNWIQGGIGTSGLIHRALPTSDRDRSTLRYDVALGLLLDGAHPFTEDHAWRQSAKFEAAKGTAGFSIGNSSYTGEPAGNLYKYQFTGWNIFTDETGWPYLDAPLTNKSEVNSWPPEALLPEIAGSIITNYVLMGYSDLSMHPRNKTKKEIIRKRANHDLFSSGSVFQKTIAQRMDELEPFEPGWWTHNFNSLCLSSWNDGGGVKSPALAYHNTGDKYKIDWKTDEVTIEFWIKPCKEQTSIGTVVQLDNSYAVALIPDLSTLKNGVYSKFKIGLYGQGKSDQSNGVPSISDTTVGFTNSTNSGRYVTAGVLNLNQWHHIAIRYGSNFNNGLLNVYIDSVSVTGTNVDGKHDGTGNRTGIFDVTSTSYTAGDTMFVGGWSPAAGSTALWGHYAGTQELKLGSNSNSVANGQNIAPSFQLKSELQELRIWSSCRSESELLASKYIGLATTAGLKLYIPFLFDPRTDTPQWNRPALFPASVAMETKAEFYQSGSIGTINSTNLDYNKTQFCTNSAYIAGMPFINVHSHLREYVNGSYPVITNHYSLSSVTDVTTYPARNNQVITGSIAGDEKRNVMLQYFQDHWESLVWLRAINSMILPSDNTAFNTDHSLLQTNMHHEIDASRLKLVGSDIASTASDYEIARFYDDEIYSIADTVNSLDPTIQNKFNGTAEQFRTSALVAQDKLEDLDYISPLSTIYAVPQIYYGNRIHPETIEMKFVINGDNKEITVKDFDGTLYRMDSEGGSYKTKVGHVDYGNGIICLFSPLLVNNGITNFDIKLKGEKNMHVMQLDIPCSTGVANKSQHPSYKVLKASANANETDKSVTYISSIYLHDENLNIIGKVNLAQPVQKREEDSFIFRVKVDF